MKTGSYFLVILILSSKTIWGQPDKFGQAGNFSDVNTVYEYRKSNWDGTHSSAVFLYVADSNRLESFKWWEGDDEATLVVAFIDWKTFSVTEFQNHKLKKGKAPELTAKLSGQRKLHIEVMGMHDSLLIAELPWQSYDFDFASLGFTWRSLKDKKAPFWFHIADVGLVNNQPRFVNKGKVDVKFIGYDPVNNKNCLKYSADGAGLENKGGHIWINPETYMIEQYKIVLPDEPGYQDGMLQLVKTFKLDPRQWELFKRQKLGE